MTHTIFFFIYIFWALLFLKTYKNCLNICCLLCILGKESNTVGWIFPRQGGNPPLTKQICLLSTLGYFGLKRCKPNFPSGLILLNDPLILTLDGSNSQFYDTGFSRDCSLPILANPSSSEISLYNYKNHSISTKSWQKSASNPISFKCALVELSLKTDVTYLKIIQIDFF